jgi:hypothetical protein
MREFESRGLAGLTRIGVVRPGPAGVLLIGEDGRAEPLDRLGYGHFGEHKIKK